jgi:tetratricopeptide (TPR) repeat protein
MARGKYDTEGDFRKSIKDRETQENLQAQQRVVQTEDYRQAAVERARKDFAQDPNQSRNIYNLAQALSALRTDEAENEAIELLENACKSKQDFSFKQRAGQIKIKQLQRKIRKVRAAVEAKADDAGAKSKLEELSAQLNAFELEHFRLNVQNYPTDLPAKYEYAVRLMQNRQYNEAIPLFQEAQKDPRRNISAMNKIGLCFFLKGWLTDAIDVFRQAIESYEVKEDNLAKELRYNLGRAYEEHGQTDKALEIYRKIAQVDFAYKDASQRVDKLRQEGSSTISG